MEEAFLLREGLGLLPVFLVHMSAGMLGSFTTILIHFFQHSQPSQAHYTTLLGRLCCATLPCINAHCAHYGLILGFNIGIVPTVQLFLLG